MFSLQSVAGIDVQKEKIGKGVAPRLQRHEGIPLTDAQEEYMLSSFFMILVGRPGSGKTYAIERLLRDENFYYKKFDEVLIVSPSLGKLNMNVPKENTKTTFELNWLHEKIKKFNKEQFKAIHKLVVPKENDDRPTNISQSYIKTLGLTRDLKEGKDVGVINSKLLKHDQNATFFTSQVIATALGNGRLIFDHPAGVINKRKLKMKRKDAQETKVEPQLQEDIQNDPEWVEKHLVSKLTEAEQRDTHKNYLLILDDMVSQVKAEEFNPSMIQLFFNRRHLVANATFSIMMITQKYNKIPAAIRVVSDWLIIFKLNPADFELIKKEVTLFGKKEWESLLDYVFEGKNMNNNKKEKKYNSLGIWPQYDKYFKDFIPIKSNSDHNPSRENDVNAL